MAKRAKSYMLAIDDYAVWKKFKAKATKNETTMKDVLWKAVLDYVKSK